MRVTLGDVAENAGVSQATASRVLNGKDGVSRGTRSAVISAANTLGYRRARPRTGRVIGVVLPEQRAALAARTGLDEVDAVERGSHTDDFAPLWEEMTMVRRSAPAGAQW